MSATQHWFEVSKEGLAKLLERRGKGYAVIELIQNGLDEASQHVDVKIKAVTGEARCLVEVIDDNPEGFKDLTHAYTLFAESTKSKDPEKRGRFNMGDKMFLSLCEEATIETTKGTIRFDELGRENFPRRKRHSGSHIYAILKLNRAEIAQTMELIRSLIIPLNVEVTLNDEPLIRPKILKQFESTLATEWADENGVLRRSRRKTLVNIYEPKRGEDAMLYELGIPVVETGDRWHYDVRQRVPLNLERDNVPPSYLHALRGKVLNVMADEITEDDAKEQWVRQGLEDPDISAEAVIATMEKLFGPNRVSYDPSDPEANKLAAVQGYTVVPGGSFNKETWQNVRRTGAIKPAGQVTPSMQSMMGSAAAEEAHAHATVLFALEEISAWLKKGELSMTEKLKMSRTLTSWKALLDDMMRIGPQ